jgi:phospholipid transport system substrate-binding protein
MPVKTLIFLFLILTLGSTNAWGASASPQDLVKSTSDQMIVALKKNRATLKQNPGKIYDLVHSIIIPNFDFDLMSRWVLGKNWKQASPQQQQRFIQEFRTFLVRTYAGALLEYTDEEIRFLPTPSVGAGADDVTVRSEVLLKAGTPIPVNYSLHLNKDKGWKVYDVSVDGISLVTNYRSTFATQVRDGGMDALINDLSTRNKKGSK